MFLLCKNERALWSVEKRSRWLRRPPCWKRGPDVGAETPRPGELRRREAARRPGWGARRSFLGSWPSTGRSLPPALPGRYPLPAHPAPACPEAASSGHSRRLGLPAQVFASLMFGHRPGRRTVVRTAGRPFAGRRLPSAGPGSERLCSSRRTLSQGRPLGHVSRGRFSSQLWERTWG